MKRKTSVGDVRNTPVLRKRGKTARNGHRNGNGDGSRAGNGDGDADVLESQPAIETILARRGSMGDQLDKAQLLAALIALRKGDFSVRLPIDLSGVDGKIGDTFNDVVELNQKMAMELE